MDNHKRLIISLRGFLQSGEQLLANLDNSQLAFEYLDNFNKIRNYIFDNYFHDSNFRKYYNELLKISPDVSGRTGETIVEKIVNSNQKTSSLIEIFGITLSPEKEKQRDELMLLVSEINRKTRAVLQQINSAINNS